VAAIEYRGISKVFADGTTAVDAFDLVIEDGEFLVLVGPSGSGKTTVLRMTAGLEEVTAGDVVIGGARVNGVAPMDRNIAMVFQNYALYPHMTVYENMAFGLKLHGLKKQTIRPRVEGTAHMLGIAELLKRKPAQLSGGQRQRVAMGRAIVRDPAAFLMDEPLSNLDAKLRVEMRSYVAMLHQRLRTTTLYVTHDQIEAMTMGSRVAVMRNGRLEQCAPPQELYEQPQNMFVAAFIGSPAMNLLRGRLVRRDDGLAVELGETAIGLPRVLLERRPGLAEHAGRPIVVGVRPEDMEDVEIAGRNGNPVLSVRVALAEAMGADVLAHFAIKGEPAADGAVADALSEPGEDADDRRYLQLAGDHADDEVMLTARLSPRTRARTGEPLELVLDAARLHFFDPQTEAAIS
jgi:multiple sugar transport system ATP-binding protein